MFALLLMLLGFETWDGPSVVTEETVRPRKPPTWI